AQRRPCDAGTGGRGARRRGRRGGRRPRRSMTRFLARHELRAAFARSLSRMYGTEVPAYTTLVEVATEVNAETMARDPDTAQRLGAIDRVTAERHGAIRVGTAEELRQVAQLFAGLGMHPVGYYDLGRASCRERVCV